MVRRVSIFGSTGSIGQNTVELISRNQNEFDVVALSGGRNVALLAQQARDLAADIAVTAFPECFAELKSALAGTGITAAAGPNALLEAADRRTDWAMSAIVGVAGLAPGLKVLEQGATLALANKESLVTAGPLLLARAKRSDALVLPVDSEHSAVFQTLVGEEMSTVERVIITASGGAFWNWSEERMARATPQEASRHPNWSMGQRITIDSSSLFNKAMELIETKEYFGFSPDKIEAVIHPESVVHAIVGFRDGAMLAHMGTPDMRHAIGYALNWPYRRELPVERLDFTKLSRLTFEAPDMVRFPALKLAQVVMEEGGLSGAVFNGAKERALDGFISGEIGFLDMSRIVETVLLELIGSGHTDAEINLDNVTSADHLARERVAEMIVQRRRA